MKDKIAITLTAVALTITGLCAIAWWFTVTPPQEFKLRIADPTQEHIANIPTVDIKGTFKQLTGTPSSIQGSWPRFRGADFDNINKEEVALANSWPKEGPKKLWSIDVGEGYAGPAIHNGRVYLLDYDEESKADTLRCLSLDDGKDIWQRSYKVKIKRNHGMSRTVPAVSDKYVVTIGPKCHVMCVRADTGEFLWGIDLAKEFNTTVPLWYTGQCPLIDNGQAIIAPGGDALMIGVDCETGVIAWKTDNPKKKQMSHSSITPFNINGKKVYSYCAVGGIVGVSAEEDKGTLLWESSEWTHSVMAPAPVHVGNGRLFLTAGYGVGSAMLEVKEDTVETIFALERKVFACEQQTPIFYKKHLFTVMPNDAGALKRQAACMRPDGTSTWTSGKENRFGLGPFIIADDKLLILDDEGTLTLAEANPNKYIQLAQAKVLEGPDSWGPMALVQGRLILRDFKHLICLDIRK